MPLDHGEHAGKLRLDHHQALVDHAGINRLPGSLFRVPFFDLVADLGYEALAGGKAALCSIAVPALVRQLGEACNAPPEVPFLAFELSPTRTANRFA